jgi:hypothetical protein
MAKAQASQAKAPQGQTTPPPFAGGPEAAAVVQQNLDNLKAASERFMKGVVKATVQQIELSRGLFEGGMEDFSLLAKAHTPETFVQAELDVFRRRSERVIAAMQTLSDELRKTWGEAFEAAEAAKPAAKSATPDTGKPAD